MPTRICKVCKIELKNNDYYFCSNCGSILEVNQINTPILKDQIIEKIDLTTNNYYLDYFLKVINSFYFIIFVFLMSLGTLIFVFFSGNSSNLNKNYISSNNVNEKNIDTCSNFLICSTFNKSKISEIVPFDVSLYIEAFDYDTISKYFLQYNNNYSEIVYNLSYLEPTDIVIFTQYINDTEYQTVILNSTKEPNDIIIDMLTKKNSGISFNKLNSYYILSNNPYIMKSIENTLNKINKSVKDTTEYTLAINKNKKGQMLIIDYLSSNDDYFNSLLLDTQVPNKVKEIINNILSSEKNYIVL